MQISLHWYHLGMTTPRGLVVPITPDQILIRALYLARLVDAEHLDPHVRAPHHMVRDIYYRLPSHNGGADPTACDPASEWQEVDEHGVQHERRTCDCSGADSWIHGHDRLQPKRMAPAVGYGGYWNTNSKIIDATRVILNVSKQGARCFVAEDKPRPGLIVVCKSGAPGHKIGHEETIIEAPADWHENERECWESMRTSGCRGSGNTANGPSTARGWYRTGALFLRSVMVP